MCKSLYQLKNDISEKILVNPNACPNTSEDSIKKYTERILNPMAELFNISIKKENQRKNNEKYNIPDKLATLIEIETETMYINQKDTPKKSLTTLITYITHKYWNEITADDLRSFFLPIFKSEYINQSQQYFLDFEDKLNCCLDYYSMINPNYIPTYLSDDIISFINCVYSQEEVPTRDYKKLLEILESGEI